MNDFVFKDFITDPVGKWVLLFMGACLVALITGVVVKYRKAKSYGKKNK